MDLMKWIAGCLAVGVLSVSAHAGTRAEKIHNERTVVYEETLAPGDAEESLDKLPSMLVYMSNGEAQMSAQGNKSAAVHEGETVFEPADAGAVRNAGSHPLHFVRVEFLTQGKNETWGMSGLPPNYTMLVENQYARAYDIKIPAQSREPRHTHHDRVVISLSGARLEHILPDGKVQPSTLKTGEIVWRPGGTHVGHNMGDTNLWVIAVEPK